MIIICRLAHIKAPTTLHKGIELHIKARSYIPQLFSKFQEALYICAHLKFSCLVESTGNDKLFYNVACPKLKFLELNVRKEWIGGF